ncbi:MAG: hypothetical protein L3V56_10210 [Candidatus Magnetoovum sp. WYHC-5]|nr:hypothetical protein [Candidatus Magnetoovum sp. WYHC-5]
MKTVKVKFSKGSLELIEKANIPEDIEFTIEVPESEEEAIDKWHIHFVSEEEQQEIEELLKNLDCHIVAYEETVEI